MSSNVWSILREAIVCGSQDSERSQWKSICLSQKLFDYLNGAKSAMQWWCDAVTQPIVYTSNRDVQSFSLSVVHTLGVQSRSWGQLDEKMPNTWVRVDVVQWLFNVC